jgi:hypothetical protein
MIIMMDNEGNKAASTVDDIVEVMDGEVLLGLARVTNGSWSLPPSTLSIGQHRLTARHNGIVSGPWSVEVKKREPVVYVDDFETAAEGTYTVISRPHFTVRNQVSGTTGPYTPFTMRIIMDDTYPGIVGRSLDISTHWDSRANCSCTATIEFNRELSTVAFNAVRRTGQTYYTPTLIEVFDKSHRVIESYSIQSGHGVLTRVELGTIDRQVIKSIVIYVVPMQNTVCFLSVDLVTMTE